MPSTSRSKIPWGYLTWPSRISLLRLLLVPPFVVLVQHHHEQPLYRYAALGIFVVMAVSDFLDGFLARRLHVSGRIGALLDPLADKTLIICSAVLLSLPHSAVAGAELPDWVVVMIVGKDLWVIIGFSLLFVFTGKAHIVPTMAGKSCTAGQLAMVVSILASPDLDRLGRRLGSGLAEAMWLIVAGLCVLAVIAYTRVGVRIAAEADTNHRHTPGR